MNKITNQQKLDIEMLMNRYFSKECHHFLVNHFSDKEAKNLSEMSFQQAHHLYNYLALDALKFSKIFYVVAIAFQNEMYDIYSAEYTAAHRATFNHLSKQQFKKKLDELTLEELDEFIKPFERIEAARQEREKGKQRSANYYEATKATNQLLKSLDIPKEEVTRKKPVKGK